MERGNVLVASDLDCLTMVEMNRKRGVREVLECGATRLEMPGGTVVRDNIQQSGA